MAMSHPDASRNRDWPKYRLLESAHPNGDGSAVGRFETPIGFQLLHRLSPWTNRTRNKDSQRDRKRYRNTLSRMYKGVHPPTLLLRQYRQIDG
jgi:hypothetical protein